MSKTLLLLGGARYALPVIEAAHELDVRVVTCDYLPDNYAHKFSDAYINASIIDKDAVLGAAEEIRADGVMSFAADPGVVSAAYAAEKLGLPFQGSYEAVGILQDKNRFRNFLRENGFNCPVSMSFSSRSEAEKAAGELPYPVIVKPADSAGSKGVTRVDVADELGTAVDFAISFSKTHTCIIEQFLEKVGDSSDADSFLLNGEFKCISFTSQVFDPKVPNPYTPAAYAMPASMPEWAQSELASELQRLANLLGLRDGVFNVETRVATDGKAYIMELAPRGGGNRLCEMLRYASGEDLIRAAVQAAVGLPVDEVGMPKYDGYWYQLMLHSDCSGMFEGIKYAPGFKEAHVVEEQLWIEPGDHVEAFTAANHAFGSIFMRFASAEELENVRQSAGLYLECIVS